MGEALHLSHAERIEILKATRMVLDREGFTNVPIIIGTGAGSTRETIELSKEAAAAGADCVIVIASGYFSGILASHRPALKAFWSEVSDKSPIPVIIYNCKLSCGSVLRNVVVLTCNLKTLQLPAAST
jgi:4-hydroxy-2-oxoglutarate aldolase